jgi:ankyrin repeat protein
MCVRLNVAMAGHQKVVNILIQHQADVNVMNLFGETPQKLATLHHHYSLKFVSPSLSTVTTAADAGAVAENGTATTPPSSSNNNNKRNTKTPLLSPLSSLFELVLI